MNNLVRLSMVASLVIAVTACGGNSPTAPTPVPPPVATTPPPVVQPPPAQPQITNYAGRWVGAYIVEQCAGSSGSMDDVLCSAPRGSNPGGIFQRGVSLPVTLELAQTGAAVTGTLALGGMRGNITGSVVNARLILSGTIVYSDASVGLTVTNVISNWDTATDGTFLTGTFTFNVRVNVFPGDGVVGVRLSNVRR
jgi:hypothetical protein